MAKPTTLGQLLVADAFPEDMRRSNYEINKKTIRDLMRELADKHPDQYKDVAQNLMVLGQYSAETTGNSIRLKDFRKPPEVEAAVNNLRRRVRAIAESEIPRQQKEAKIIKLVSDESGKLRDQLLDLATKDGNNFAIQVLSGSRGNANQFQQLVLGDGLVADHLDRPIPIPILHGYAEGLTPAEYFAGSYGARKGTVATKKATAEAGFFGKQLAHATHRLVVTEDDCGTNSGVHIKASEKDNVGYVLAADTGPYKAGTIVTPAILKELGEEQITLRSPMTCQASDGLCSKCAGVRDKGKLPSIGDNVGIPSAQSVSEKMSQGMLCLAKDTMVRMADYSVKAIQDIQPGDKVLGSDTEGRTFPTTVVRTYDNGIRECYSTKFRKTGTQGTSIELVSTLDHNILALTMKWSSAGQQYNNQTRILPVGTRGKEFKAILNCELFEDSDLVLEDEYALLIGMLLGDGCYTEAVGSVHFSQNDPLVISETADYMSTLNLKFSFHKGSQCYWRVSQIDVKPRNPIKQHLIALNMYGKYAHEKVLPSHYLELNNKSIFDILTGLWVTDGSVYKSGRDGQDVHMSISLTSKKLIEQIKELLAWRLGIHCTGPFMQSVGRKRPIYKLAITKIDEVMRFYKHVKLVGEKRKKLEEWLNVHQTSPATKYARCSRVSQDFVGEMPTYDIEVDSEDHLFVLANGLIVSNSTKHAGGQVGASGPSKSGFKYVDRLVQVQKNFVGAAALAPEDGIVNKIVEAPQGGHYVFVGDKRMYVDPEQEVSVKIGQNVEAGDVLSNGTPNPADIVRYKGIGEGRRYFIEAFGEGLKASGIGSHRRNLETIARGLINHVRITDAEGYDGFMPDDVVTFDSLQRRWKPREGFREVSPIQAKNMYLEKPVLHYSIGTRVTPRVIKSLQDAKIDRVTTHQAAPPFESVMVRAMENAMRDEDWQTRMYGTYLGKGFTEAVQRNRTSNIHSTSFVPGLAHGSEFGKSLKTDGKY